MIQGMIVDACPSGTCVQHTKRLHFLDARLKLYCVPDMKFASKTPGRASARPLLYMYLFSLYLNEYRSHTHDEKETSSR